MLHLNGKVFIENLVLNKLSNLAKKESKYLWSTAYIFLPFNQEGETSKVASQKQAYTFKLRLPN